MPARELSLIVTEPAPTRMDAVTWSGLGLGLGLGSGLGLGLGLGYVLVLFLLATTQPLLAARLHAIGAAAGVKPQFTFGAPRRPADLALSCALLERAIDTNPRDGESWSQLGHNRMHAQRPEDAARCFATAAGLSGGPNPNPNPNPSRTRTCSRRSSRTCSGASSRRTRFEALEQLT